MKSNGNLNNQNIEFEYIWNETKWNWKIKSMKEKEHIKLTTYGKVWNENDETEWNGMTTTIIERKLKNEANETNGVEQL